MYYLLFALLLFIPQTEAAMCGDGIITSGEELCDKLLGNMGCPENFFCNTRCKCQQCTPLGNPPSRNHAFNQKTCQWECPRQLSCKYPQFFNQNTCACECRAERPPGPLFAYNAKTCRWECPQSTFCPAGNTFNTYSCKCEPTTGQAQKPKRRYIRVIGKTVAHIPYFRK